MGGVFLLYILEMGEMLGVGVALKRCVEMVKHVPFYEGILE